MSKAVLPFVNRPVGLPKSIPHGLKLALESVGMQLLLPTSAIESPKINTEEILLALPLTKHSKTAKTIIHPKHLHDIDLRNEFTTRKTKERVTITRLRKEIKAGFDTNFLLEIAFFID